MACDATASHRNHFGNNGSHGNGPLGAARLMRIADAMVRSGLRDAGYRYVNQDGGWAVGRAANGSLVPDPFQFPHGTWLRSKRSPQPSRGSYRLLATHPLDRERRVLRVWLPASTGAGTTDTGSSAVPVSGASRSHGSAGTSGAGTFAAEVAGVATM